MTPFGKGASAVAVLLLAVWIFPGSVPAVRPDPAGLLAKRGSDDGEEGHRGRHRRGRGGVDAAPAVSVNDPEAKGLFEAKCSLCHPLSRPLRKSRERKWWIETVTRMQQVNGCPITDEEAWRIIDYLAIVRGPGAPRGPDDDGDHEGERGAPVPRGERGPGPAAPSTGGGAPEAKALFESKCSICHPVSRPLGKTKDRAGWTATVTRMKNGNGCPITDAEAGVIIDYLTNIRGSVAR
ncbi:MAG: hypothetical protein WBB46_11440 [Candidatus Deferrimicrobiaceae bacterium]